MLLPETEMKEAVEALVSNSSSSSKHLLPCLQKLEDSLMKMGPSQYQVIQNVFGCAIQALARKELLNHRDLRVRVSMASCFCHILRMMTLDVPFGSDELLKEVLGLVVSAFDNISDTSSGLYHKRISILKTFEKARLFILMVNLECDEIIVGMFKCFLGNISETQPDAVFSSMGSVMILTLIKMKRVPFELTLNLLQTVRNGNEDVSPVARKLAERVLENCDLKLAPRMSEAVQHLGFPLDDYSRAVAHVCSRQFESQAKTEGLGFEDDASEENVRIDKTEASKLNLDTNGYLTPMKSIECNADKRRGCRKSGSSNKSCEESVKVRVEIRNDSSSSLPVTKSRNVSARKVCGQTDGNSLSEEAGSSVGGGTGNGVSDAANSADEERGTSTAGDSAKVARFASADGSAFKIRFLEKLGGVKGKEKHASERDPANGRNADQSKDAANGSSDMPKGRSSEDGSKAKAIDESPTKRARTGSNKKAGMSRSPEDLPLSALLHKNSKTARSIGRRRPHSVGQS